jgi:hypothetical protein
VLKRGITSNGHVRLAEAGRAGKADAADGRFLVIMYDQTMTEVARWNFVKVAVKISGRR